VSLTPPDRRVVTFYSYKGGVGRSMAMANVAYRLANTHGLNVIAVDWDLEAPGLHRFFGVSRDDAVKVGGVLDYFIAWRDAVRRKSPEAPPEVRDVAERRDNGGWIIPIKDEPHRPRFGSVSLLLAGRMDKAYDDRLASLHWDDFYEKDHGALAVETLREKLVGKADVVLIDSRTGLSDTGGVCSIQIPDGVVLITAPNQQSIEGTEIVARSIAKATVMERADRKRVRVWLAVGRISSVEETYLAGQWFEKHKDWFEKGRVDGLWRREDHMDGLRTHMIPQRARWAFDEVVLNEATMVDPKDPLVVAYEELTSTLLGWMRKEPPLIREQNKEADPPPSSIEKLEQEVKHAEERGDMLGVAFTLMDLASALNTAHRTLEGVRKLDRAIAIFASRGARSQHMHALGMSAHLLMIEDRQDEAHEAFSRLVEVSRELGHKKTEAEALTNLAAIRALQGHAEEAIRLFDEACAADRDESMRYPAIFRPVIHALYQSGRGDAVGLLRDTVNSAHEKANAEQEKSAISVLLEMTADAPLPDDLALRARLAELDAAWSTPR
jgi:MinD-like ATPase involved in chromosome partitioning or flagellar assembly/tetratricopeptide (TPR) repeat protein